MSTLSPTDGIAAPIAASTSHAPMLHATTGAEITYSSGSFSSSPAGRITAKTASSRPAHLVSQKTQRDVVFAEFRPLVQRLIRKYGDTPELRSDLEGEIYCIFCHLYDVFDPARGIPLKAYLVHQLTTSTYTFARRHWGQARREICMEIREDTTSETNPSRHWDDEMLMQQARGQLAEAIAKLPLRQRQVVIWRYYEHRSFEEIAELLHVQTATTRSLLRHGMNNLRRFFEKANVAL